MLSRVCTLNLCLAISLREVVSLKYSLKHVIWPNSILNMLVSALKSQGTSGASILVFSSGWDDEQYYNPQINFHAFSLDKTHHIITH